MPLSQRAHSLNQYCLSRVWFRCLSFNLRLGDHTQLNSKLLLGKLTHWYIPYRQVWPLDVTLITTSAVIYSLTVVSNEGSYSSQNYCLVTQLNSKLLLSNLTYWYILYRQVWPLDATLITTSAVIY